jgi:predicted RecA/RadA family phage recombinase
MKNRVQNGNTLTFIAVADVLSGQGLLLGGTVFGVSAYDVKTGDEGEAQIEGVFSLPKAAVVTTAFAAAYWDNAAKVTTNVAAGNTLIGFYTLAGAASAATNVRLVPKAA